jgi:hypothetical protein
MKATFFSKPLEWNIETPGESWQQGDLLNGVLKVRNHGTEQISLAGAGVALAHADIKKVHSRVDGALKPEQTLEFSNPEIKPGETSEIEFNFPISPNGAVTDKKASYYLAFGKSFVEGHLQVKVEPKALYSKIIGLLDTFHRFKLKEYKTVKKGVEFKLLPPTARDMANIETLLLTFSMDGENLVMKYDFQVKRLDTSGVTNKINKESVSIEKILIPKEYSLGRDMINQDQILKSMGSVLSEVKIKAVF